MIKKWPVPYHLQLKLANLVQRGTDPPPQAGKVSINFNQAGSFHKFSNLKSIRTKEGETGSPAEHVAFVPVFILHILNVL